MEEGGLNLVSVTRVPFITRISITVILYLALSILTTTVNYLIIVRAQVNALRHYVVIVVVQHLIF